MARTREQERVYQLARYHKRRAEGIALLGGKCIVCGSTEKLEFDHVDPALKDFDVSRPSLSRAVWLAELAKCQLLCEEHHDEKHKSTAPCGTDARYTRGCRCEECRAAHRQAWVEWKARTGYVRPSRAKTDA